MDDVGVMAKCGNDTLMLNIFLTTLKKRLKFKEGNATKNGHCFEMHVGNNKKKLCQN